LSGWPVSEPRFGPWTSGVQSRDAITI
jgi:hypothetical protein